MMEDLSIKEKISNQINIDKEILSVLPKNTKKNLQIYKDKAAEIKQEYSVYLDEILSEMKRRAVKIKSFTPNPKIKETEEEIKKLDKINFLINHATSFEKMELDEILYVLKRFYKNNLEIVNESIIKCLDKFKMVGIDLSLEDFNYSIYTREYMKVFLEDFKKGDSNSARIKDTFEQIYWKCPDLIIHIELNFRYLYLKYEKTINKYFEEVKKQIIKELSLDEKNSIEKYRELQYQLIELKNSDTALILQKFLNNDATPKSYEEANINKLYKKLLGTDIFELDKEHLDDVNQNIYRLQKSLYEYKNYLRFSFIYDDILDIYKSTEKFKNLYNQKLKQIKKMEAKLFKTNKKIERIENHKGFILKLFGKNKLETINVDANSQILEIKKVYRDLEENKIKNIISTSLTDASTIYDALLLVCPFYSFLVNAMIDQYPDITQDELHDTIIIFRRFIQYPKITIINNTKIDSDKDLALVIKDKYNLCNINITKGDLDEENVSNLIDTVNTICEYNYIKNCKISLEDIQFLLETNKILGEMGKH